MMFFRSKIIYAGGKRMNRWRRYSGTLAEELVEIIEDTPYKVIMLENIRKSVPLEDMVAVKNLIKENIRALVEREMGNVVDRVSLRAIDRWAPGIEDNSIGFDGHVKIVFRDGSVFEGIFIAPGYYFGEDERNLFFELRDIWIIS